MPFQTLRTTRNLTLLFVSLFVCLFFWMRGGLNSIYVDTDLGRDLFELSNIWQGKTVWLGPRLSPGLHASPIYYYAYLPLLWISNGSAYSLVVTNLIIATLSLGTFGFFGLKRYGNRAILGVLFIGLSAWRANLSMHPGNGYTYALWLFLSLTALWYKLPFFVSAFFFGLATSYHPAALFVAPILFYEWLKKENKGINLLLSSVAFLIPWSPLIAFEIITKGYLLRSWLEKPSVGFELKLSLENIRGLFSASGFSIGISLLLWLIMHLLSEKRIRKWFLIASISVTPLMFFSKLMSHYYLGIVTMFWFIAAIILLEAKQLGKNLLTIIVLISFITLLQRQPTEVFRSIGRLQSIAEQVQIEGIVEENERVAVVAILDNRNASPQADDYRFFLRMKGFNVLDVDNYDQADVLLLFVEEPAYDWKGFSSWEMDHFGEREIVSQKTIHEIKVITFRRPL